MPFTCDDDVSNILGNISNTVIKYSQRKLNLFEESKGSENTAGIPYKQLQGERNICSNKPKFFQALILASLKVREDYLSTFQYAPTKQLY